MQPITLWEGRILSITSAAGPDDARGRRPTFDLDAAEAADASAVAGSRDERRYALQPTLAKITSSPSWTPTVAHLGGPPAGEAG